MRVVVSPAAEADLADIFDYSHAAFGEIQAAEDVVQESWLRWSAAPPGSVVSPGPWLTQLRMRGGIRHTARRIASITKRFRFRPMRETVEDLLLVDAGGLK